MLKKLKTAFSITDMAELGMIDCTQDSEALMFQVDVMKKIVEMGEFDIRQMECYLYSHGFQIARANDISLKIEGTRLECKIHFGSVEHEKAITSIAWKHKNEEYLRFQHLENKQKIVPNGSFITIPMHINMQ